MEKVDALLEEAKNDIEAGCYNKDISAYYFTVRMEVEKLTDRLRTMIPRRDDKLIDILKYMDIDELSKDMFYFMKEGRTRTMAVKV